MAGQDVGYVRVSSVLQNTERQLSGVPLDRVFEDKISGKDTNRPALAECVAFVRDGDTLHVHAMDRLARNLDDLRSIVKELTSKGVLVRFHKEGLTFSAENSPMATLMLSLIGAVAEFERSLILERQREGIAIAKQAGAYKGRKPSLTGDLVEQAKARVAAGESKAAVARSLGVSRQTLYAHLAG